MSKDKIQKNYVSEIDQFLQGFDRSHPEKSKNQQKEIAKAERVKRSRDQAGTNNAGVNQKIWEKF